MGFIFSRTADRLPESGAEDGTPFYISAGEGKIFIGIFIQGTWVITYSDKKGSVKTDYVTLKEAQDKGWIFAQIAKAYSPS